MAFCRQCGADLNGANFCAGCGTPADGVVAQQVAPVAADPRQQTIVEMNRMQVYFGTKADVYRKYDEVASEVHKRSEDGFFGWIGAAILCVVIGLFSKAIFFYIAAALFVVGFVLKKKKNNQKLAEATALLNKLGAELSQFYEDYGYCPIGIEYTHPDAFSELCAYITKGRANTFSEAINCKIDDDERKKAEDDRKKMIEQNEDIIRETTKARRYSAANFWIKR